MTPKDKLHVLSTGFVPVIDHGYKLNDQVHIIPLEMRDDAPPTNPSS